MIAASMQAAIVVLLSLLCTSSSADTAPYIVKLQRQSLPHLQAVDESASLPFYTASMRVGNAAAGEAEQELRVIFDLGSGQVVLPSTKCLDVTCLKHRRYSRQKSLTARDINADGSAVEPVNDEDEQDEDGDGAMEQKRDTVDIGLDYLDLGPGRLTGDLIAERLCLKGAEEGDGEICVDVRIVAATRMSDLPFRVLPNDGIVGLGLTGVSISDDFNFLARVAAGSAAAALPRRFGLFLGGAEGGELALGGHDQRHVSSPLAWTPVADAEQGYWQVSIVALRIAGRTLDVCADAVGSGNSTAVGAPAKRRCRGALDTSASWFSVPPALAPSLEEPLRAALSPSSPAATVELVLDGGATLALPAASLVAGRSCEAAPDSCRPLLPQHHVANPMGEGLFVLGEAVLRQYYTVFDAETRRIGFSHMTQGKLPGVAGDNDDGAENPPKAQVLLLIQVRTSAKRVRL